MENEKQILNYLQDNLSTEERTELENRLSTDVEFAKEYELLRSMHMYALMDHHKEKWQPALDELGSKYFNAKSITSSNSKSWIKAIALIIALLGLAFLAFYLNRDTQDLYEKHIDHFALHLTLKSSDNSQAQALQAETSFNSEDYTSAYSSLQLYLVTNPIDTKARLALGICALELNKQDEAVSIFDEIRKGKSTLKDYATWYKAMYEVKNANYSNANLLLADISSFDPKLLEKANLLQKDLAELLD